MNNERFLTIVAELAASLGWKIGSFARDEEFIAVAPLDHDPQFEQIMWVLPIGQNYVRCLLICRGTVPPEREAAIVELCARINDGLVFGCAEYSFDERTMLFRESANLGEGRVPDLMNDITSRVLGLGSRCADAVQETLAGSPAADAMKHLNAEEKS